MFPNLNITSTPTPQLFPCCASLSVGHGPDRPIQRHQGPTANLTPVISSRPGFLSTTQPVQYLSVPSRTRAKKGLRLAGAEQGMRNRMPPRQTLQLVISFQGTGSCLFLVPSLWHPAPTDATEVTSAVLALGFRASPQRKLRRGSQQSTPAAKKLTAPGCAASSVRKKGKGTWARCLVPPVRGNPPKNGETCPFALCNHVGLPEKNKKRHDHNFKSESRTLTRICSPGCTTGSSCATCPTGSSCVIWNVGIRNQ